MRRPSVDEQIRDVDRVYSEKPFLRPYLSLHRVVLEARRGVEALSGKGTALDLSDPAVVKSLEDKALSLGKPIAQLVDSSVFNLGVLRGMLSLVIVELLKRDIRDKEQFEAFLKLLREGFVDISKLVDLALKDDAKALENYARELNVESRVLQFLSYILVQPFLEEVARKVSDSFLEKWWRRQCPVCGRAPVIARVRADTRKRYLTCMLCGAEYAVDLFLCPFCGNRDPNTLGFLAIEGEPSFRIDFCEKCRHYVKVIDEGKLRAPVPRGLEDILTLELDRVAQEAGLARD